MTGITVTQQVVEVVVAPPQGPQVVLAVPAPPVVVVTPLGAQGPEGPPADTITSMAIGALSALRVVALASGGVGLVDPSSPASLARMIGITINAAASGASVVVRLAGTMTDAAWSWPPGQPLFCGAGGVLTAIAPVTVASRQIGVAVDATTILINPSDLIILE